MVPSAIVVEIQRHDFQDIIDTTIYPLLTSENRRLCNMFPWPFTEKFVQWTETYNAGNVGAPLTGAPTDIRAVRNFGSPAEQANGGNIEYLRRDILEKTYGYNSYLLADVPRFYNVWGKNATGGCNLYIYPYILANTIFALDYHALPPVLSAGTTEAQMLLPDEFVPILIDRVLARLSRAEGDLEDGNTFDARATSAVAEMMDAFDANMDSPDPPVITDWDDGWN